MSADAITIARPYAEAAFSRAAETDKLDLWSDMLALLAAVSRDPAMTGLIASPKLDRRRKSDLLLEIGGGRLSDEGQNLVRVLADIHGRNRDRAITELSAACYAFAVMAPLAMGAALALDLGWRAALLIGVALGNVAAARAAFTHASRLLHEETA